MIIYILEDNSLIRELEAYALKAAGFEVRGFSDADGFLEAARQDPPSLAILDVMLPGAIDGLEVMKRLSRFSPHTFVIIASAKGSEFDRVRGLDLGADDYLAKPFSMLEMTSRVKAVLRRGGVGESETLSAGDVVLDKSGHTVIVSGQSVSLTRREFQLLEIFLFVKLVRECVESLRTAAEEASVRLTLSTPLKSERPVHGSPHFLEAIVFNLVVNAINYNKADGVVDVKLVYGSDHLTLTVADTGIGIDKSHHGRIFERFYRVDKGRSRKSGGTGLGLSIVRNAVRLHKGEVSLESVPGNGSTFTVALPYRRK